MNPNTNPYEAARKTTEDNMDNPLVMLLSALDNSADTPEKRNAFGLLLTKIAYKAAEKMPEGYEKEFRLMLCDTMQLTDNLHVFLSPEGLNGIEHEKEKPFPEEQIADVRNLLQSTNRLIEHMLVEIEGHTEDCDHE